MKHTGKYILPSICFLLILLWAYAASSKLMDFGMFKAQMQKQMLFPFLKTLMPYLLPPAEIIIVISLLFERLQKIGIYFSFAALLAFTIYIGLGIAKVFGRVPCSCGGILNRMGWGTHFLFNIFFLLLTALGIYIINRERRPANQKT